MPNYRRLFIPNTYIFLTITTNYRRSLLVDNIELLRKSFRRAKETYSFKIYASVILPDHIHLIIRPENILEYPKIIFAIKYHFSRNIKINDGGVGTPPYATSDSKIQKSEKAIWQRRYWEHTIRDEKDLNNHLDYIHYNPVKHKLVQNVKDWKFSSFHQFVKTNNYDLNWGNSKDVENIKKLEYD